MHFFFFFTDCVCHHGFYRTAGSFDKYLSSRRYRYAPDFVIGIFRLIHRSRDCDRKSVNNFSKNTRFIWLKLYKAIHFLFVAWKSRFAKTNWVRRMTFWTISWTHIRQYFSVEFFSISRNNKWILQFKTKFGDLCSPNTNWSTTQNTIILFGCMHAVRIFTDGISACVYCSTRIMVCCYFKMYLWVCFHGSIWFYRRTEMAQPILRRNFIRTNLNPKCIADL